MPFLNPWMLFWITAGSAPIVIHLLNRQRFKRVIWAAMNWLFESHRKSRRRLRIEELILLLIRIAILALLALALARPLLDNAALYDRIYWLFFSIPLALAVWAATELRMAERFRWIGRLVALLIAVSTVGWVVYGTLAGDARSRGSAWSMRTRGYRVIVLDHSFSMGQLPGGRSIFEKAKEVAVFLLKPESGLGQGDQVSVILAGDEAKGLIKDPTSDLRAAREEVAALKVSDAATNLPRALAEAYRYLGQSNQARKEIFVITDMTRSAWVTAQGGLRDDKLPKVIATLKPDQRPRVTIVDVGPETPPDNLAIVDLDSDTRIVAAGVPTRFRATIRNYGRKEATNVQVQFRVDGMRHNSQEIALKAGDERRVSFYHLFDEPGAASVSIDLPADGLRPDNTRTLALDVRESLKVLCVDGESKPGHLAGETDLLVRALFPRNYRDPGERSIIVPDAIDETELPDATFSAYDLVILANVGDITPEKYGVLERYVADGGSLMIFLGERVDGQLYNQRFFRNGKGLLPARLTGTRGAPRNALSQGEKVALQANPYDHPALHFFNSVRAPLATTVIYKRFECEVDEKDPSVRVALRYSDESPAIIERSFGSGRVLLLTTTADKEWTNLPEKPAYLPMMHELTYYLVRSSQRRRSILVGGSFIYNLLAADYAAELTLTDPASRRTVVTATSEAGRFVLRYGPAEQAGIYTLDIGSELGRQAFFAANVNPNESKLKRIEREEIQQQLTDLDFNLARGRDELERIISTSGKGKELWLPFVATVLALLLVECLLAQIFGRYEE